MLKDSCLAMDVLSVHTLTTPEGSPAMPSPRFFEPTTPKAMKLDPDFNPILTSSSDPSSSGGAFRPWMPLAMNCLAWDWSGRGNLSGRRGS